MANESDAGKPWRLDPVYLNARRETLVIVATCLVMAAVSLAVCFRMGMGAVSEEEVLEQAIWGVPSWVFWGLFVPWIAGTAFTAWFAFTVLRDDPLGGDEPSAPAVDVAESSRRGGQS